MYGRVLFFYKNHSQSIVPNALEVSLVEIVYDSLIKNEHVSVNTINKFIFDCNLAEITL